MSAERRAPGPPSPELGRRGDHGRGSLVALLDTIPEPIVLVGEDRRVLYANDALERLFGYEPGALGERPVEDLVRSEDRRGCLHAFAEVLDAEAGGPSQTELGGLVAETADGTPLPVAFQLRWLPIGEEPLVLATLVDRRDEIEARTQMTALDRAREQIDYQKTLLESQNEASIDGILIVDHESRIVSYNQRFLDLWGVEDELIEIGRTDEEALGSVLDRIVNVDDFLEKVEYLHENPHETIRDEVRLEDDTVLERWSTPVVSDEGTYYGRGWYFRDITDRKRVEEELRRHREELEELVAERTEELEETTKKLRAEVDQRKEAEEELEQRVWELARSNADLERFAYVASHDLQEPLRMVASYVQLLERRYRDQLDDEAEEYIDYAVEGATRMQSLIRDLLAYARVGGEAHGREVVDMDPVVDRALERLEHPIEASDAEIERGPLPSVLGNPTELVQVVEALVSNAIKFQPGDATPHLRITAKPVGDERAWHFSVEDDGLGIESAYHDRIFVLFQRLQPRAEFDGTGIGLALCKKVVENLGGRIWVESVPGEGSTFHFTLPSEDAEGETPEIPHEPPNQVPRDPS